jgi:hypothetical protein
VGCGGGHICARYIFMGQDEVAVGGVKLCFHPPTQFHPLSR